MEELKKYINTKPYMFIEIITDVYIDRVRKNVFGVFLSVFL